MEILALDTILESLNLGAKFLYKALWPILFGVLITAAIDVFANREQLGAMLGGRDLKSTGKAGLWGALSSACTYGAVTVAHSLFKKGASAESTFAFSFGATNLVFELGILIYILMGPAFLAAELLGGVVLIAIMYLIVHFTLPEKTFEEVRKQKQEAEQEDQKSFPKEDPFCGYEGNREIELEYEGTTYHFCSEDCKQTFLQNKKKRGSWKQQLKGLGGWYRIATNFFQTTGRIYKSVLGGFLIAGFIVVLIPQSFWHTLFLEPDSFWGIAENAIMGVLAGVVSFIGSIGNVPFAAALWFGGVSFAGVIACIYADLITIPVLNLWKKFYGWKIMWYVFGVFFVTMALSGIFMEYLFDAFNWIPVRPAGGQNISYNFELNFSTIMTFVMLAVTAALYGIKRLGKAKKVEEVYDPVCGMKLEKRDAAATSSYNESTYYFCAKPCKKAFEKNAEQFS